MSSHDPLDTRAQEQARRESERRRQQAAIVEGDDTRWLMSNRRGRRIVWRILERSGLYHSPFSLNTSDMAHRVGMQNEGRATLALIETHTPDQVAAMKREALE